jgi:hypothetical protein
MCLTAGEGTALISAAGRTGGIYLLYVSAVRSCSGCTLEKKIPVQTLQRQLRATAI